jgi:hypothetical protein
MTRRLHTILLLCCVLLVAFWQVMAWRARRGFDKFLITAEAFDDFEPSIEGYRLSKALIERDPLQPNIVTYLARQVGGGKVSSVRPVLIRLVHGYNMVDCMRIKHFNVEPIERSGPALASHDENEGVVAQTDWQATGFAFPYELWRLTSPIGDTSIWLTSMHRGVDLVPIEMSTTSMPFPKIGAPDAPGWHARGVSMKSFKHPLRSFRKNLQHSWNNSRCDLLTFLKLRRPIYASDEVLTVVSRVALPPANESDPARIKAEAMRMQEELHAAMVQELQDYLGTS